MRTIERQCVAERHGNCVNSVHRELQGGCMHAHAHDSYTLTAATGRCLSDLLLWRTCTARFRPHACWSGLLVRPANYISSCRRKEAIGCAGLSMSATAVQHAWPEQRPGSKARISANEIVGCGMHELTLVCMLSASRTMTNSPDGFMPCMGLYLLQ